MDPVIEILLDVLKVVIALLGLGAVTERGTETIKNFLRFLGEKFAWLNFRDRRVFLLAAGVAVFASYVLGFDVTQYLSWLDGYDPETVKLVNSLLLLLTSNKIHDNFAKHEGAG